MKTSTSRQAIAMSAKASGEGNKRRLRAMCLPLIAAVASAAVSAHAANLVWDPTHNPASPAGGAGTWDLSTQNWSTGAADQAWTDTSTTGVDTAVFGGTGGVVTLNTSLSALGLQFNTTGYTISGTGLLTLGSGGINAGSLTSGTTTIGGNISLAANQTWSTGAGSTFVDTGIISGASVLTLGGGGTFTLSGQNTNSAGLVIGAVTLDVNSNSSLGTGAVTINNGAVLDNTTGANLTNLKNNALSILGDFSFTGTSNLSLGAGTATLTGDRTITINANTLTTGAMNGNGNLTKAGAGNLFTGGGTITGVLNVTGGELGITQDFHANGGLIGNGIIINTNASPTTQDKWFFVTNNSNNTFSGQILGGTSKLGFNKSGNGTMTLTGANQIDDQMTVNNGKVIFSGSHNNTTQVDVVGTVAGANAVLVLPAGATFNSNANGGQQFSASINISTNGTGTGALEATGATIQVNRAMNVGPTGWGAYTQTAGNVTVGGFITVGGTANAGVVNLTGGTLNMTGNSMTIGFSVAAAYGVLNVGGNATMQMGTTPLGFGNGIWVGEVGSAVMTVSGNAAVNIPADSITIANGTTNGGNRTTSGILNLDGGVVTTNTITASTGSGASTSILNFNGGTLKANIDSPNFIKNATTGSGSFNVFVYGGGATIDDGGHNVTIQQPLQAPSGSGVSATGLTTSGSGFIDTPLVTITGGGGTGATAVANIDANGNLTGITITNPGTGYTSAPTFALLSGGVGNTGSITGAPTLVTNTSGGITKAGTGTVTLSGSNTYAGATNVTAGTLFIGGGGSILSPVNVTSGVFGGSGSAGNVTVASAAANGIANTGGGVLTVSNLTFSGAANLNLVLSSTSPVLNVTKLTTSGGGGVSTGKITVNASNLGVWTTGTYDLVQYGSLGGVGFADFLKGTITGLGVRQSATLTNPAGFIALTIAGDSPKWTGALSAQWSNATLSNPKNWQLIAGGTATDYIQGDTVLFDDTATGTTNVTISVANVSPTSVTFGNAGKAYSISGPFGITGTSNVTISGGGTVSLSAPSTYSGGTNLNNGVLNINSSSAIGTGALSVSGGSIDNTSGSPVTLTTNNALNLTTDLTFNGTNDLNLGTGSLVLTAARNFNINGTANLTIGGTISGNFGVSVQGNGTGALILTGNNTNVGTTSIHSAILQVAGGTFGTLTTAATGDIQVSPGVSDSGTFIVSGGVVNADRVIIAGDSGNTAGGNAKVIQTGGTINSRQWFTVGSGNAAGNSFPTGEFDMSGGTLNVIGQQMEIANFDGTTGIVNMSGNSTINIENNNFISMGANNLALDGTFNQNGGNVTFYSDAGVTIGGTGILSLGRAGSLSGTYTYNLNGGTLTVPQITQTAASGGTGVFNFNGGTLKAAGSSGTWISGVTTVQIQTGGAIIDDGGFAVTVPQNISTGNGADGGLTKQGSGVLTLSGTNSYTGPTTLNAGTLIITGTNSYSGATVVNAGNFTLSGAAALSSTSNVVIHGGSLLISGTSSINGGATINVAGGKLIQASSTALTAPVTVTSGILTGSNATINTVLVPAGGGIVANGNNDSGVLTIGSLTYNGAGAIDPTLAGPTATNAPGIIVTSLTTSGGSSTSTGHITVNPFNTGWNPGIYDLVSYSSISGVGFNDFVLGTVGGLSPRQSANLTNIAGEIALTISSGDVVIWTGKTSANWTTATIASPKNWKLQSSGNATDFINGDILLFDDTATGNTNINISDANVTVTSATFNNSNLSYSISSTGGFGITSGFIVKSGTGALSLNTANSYAGGTTLNAGKLNVNNATALGSGLITINGGTLDNTSGAAVALTTNNLVSLNGDVTFTGTNNLSLGSGLVTLGGATGARTITANGGVLTVGPIIGAAGYGLTIGGSGAVTVLTPDTNNAPAEQSTTAGDLTVLTGATLNLGAADTFFGGLIGGGTISDGSATTRWMTVGMDNSNTTFSGALVDGGAGGSLGLRKRGTGTLSLTGSNSYSSTTTIESGAVVMSGSNTLAGPILIGTANASTIGKLVLTGGALNASQPAAPSIQIGAGLNFTGSFIMTGGTLTTGSEIWLGTADGGYGYMNMSGGSATVGSWLALGRGGGQGVLDVSGNASLTVSTNNLTIGSFGGSTSDIHGVVSVSGNATVSSANNVYVGENTPGVLNVSGNATVSASGTDGVMFSKNSATTGILNLNGGTIFTTSMTMSLAGSSNANFNGGTVKAMSNTTTFINNISNAYIYNGGLTIDDGGHTITVPQLLQAPTGSGISATGLTVSGTGFIGEPVIEIAGGGGTGATAVANIDANGNLTGITITNPGVGYTSTPAFTIVGGGLGSSGSISGTATLVSNVGGGLTKVGAGSVTLTAANTYSGGTTVNAGTLTISGSIVGTNVSVAPTATLTVLASGSISTSTALTNNGTVNFSSPSLTIASLNGATASAAVNLNTTSLTVSSGGVYSGSVVDGGTSGALTVGAALSVGSFNVGSVNANANVQIHGTSKTAALNLTGATSAWTTGLDLTNSKFILESSVSNKTADLTRLRNQVAFGKTHADGIFTSAALPGTFAIAVVDNAVVSKSSFGGVAVDSNSVLVGAELLGDANIDGHVDLTDLSTVLNNFGATTSAWTSGNFDGAATIDLTDLSAVLNNFGLSNPNASDVQPGSGGAINTTAAPEPASLAVLALGASAMLCRRRKTTASA